MMDHKIFTTVVLLMSVLLAGCEELEPRAVDLEPEPAPSLDRGKTPLLIAPMIEGMDYCDSSNFLTDETKNSVRYSYCKERNFSVIDSLISLLDELEPLGAQGKAQVGFTYTVPLLSLYRKSESGWELDNAKIDQIFSNIEAAKRPVVLYLMMNHFAGQTVLSKELASDKRNLMLLASGEAPIDQFFESSIIPYTLLTDESIAINHYRFTALRAITQRYKALSAQRKAQIKGFSLIGEVHHMFENFQQGTGNFTDIKLTDYSPESLVGFRQWLLKKYDSIDSLNKQLQTSFVDWDAITPPSKDIRRGELTHFSQHLDSYAGGVLPVFGWVWQKKDSYLQGIKIYVDGVYTADADLLLNRLDVYQALEEVDTPNVGFRYDLNFSGLAPGIHSLEVIADTEDGHYLMTKRDFVYVNRQQETPKRIKYTAHNRLEGDARELSHLKFYVDYPKALQDVYYNPLAAQWNYYRAWQVENFIDHVWSIALRQGVEKSKLFSHQIAPYLNTSWNTVLFATEQTLTPKSQYLPGISLYGGGTNSELLKKSFQVALEQLYGVPEYHPQQYKKSLSSYASLMGHYNGNAAFLSPYYMTLVPKEYQGESEHKKFQIEAGNMEYGSGYLFDAIKKMAQL